MAFNLSERLTPEQAKFALLIEENAPYLQELWDFNKAEYNPQMVERFFGYAASGEIVMLKFFLAVWHGEDKFHFDITDAAAKLSQKQKSAIAEWLLNPFWP